MNSKNKRNYPRINTVLPCMARKIESASRKELKCRVSRGDMILDNSVPPEVEDERLNAWLNMINTKLDYLISREPPEREDSLFMSFEPLNISGSGMMIETVEKFQKGDILEIKMVLQSYPTKVLYLYGDVVRIEENPRNPGMKNVGLNFFNINEEVRNEIMNFDFKGHSGPVKDKVAEKRRKPSRA